MPTTPIGLGRRFRRWSVPTSAEVLTARSELDRTMQRLSSALRSLWAVWAVAVLVSAPLGEGGSFVCAALVTLWASTFAYLQLRLGSPRLAATFDVASGTLLMAAGPALLSRPMVGDGSSWVVMGASLSALIAIWVLPPVAAGVSVSLIIGGFVAGIAAVYLAPPNRDQVQTLTYLLFVWLISAVLLQIVRRSADQVDLASHNLSLVRRRYSAEHRRLAYQVARDRILHDHILTILAFIGENGGFGNLDSVRERCLRALRRIRLLEQREPADESTLVTRMQEAVDEAKDFGLSVHVDWPARDEQLRAAPPEVADAVAEAVRQAIVNVVLHAGVTTAGLSVELRSESFVFTVTDQGRGFDPGSVRSGARGIAYSIKEPLRDVGGVVEVCTSPGEGCTVRITLPAQVLLDGEPERRGFHLNAVQNMFESGMQRSIAAIGFGWHILALTFQETHTSGYHSLAAVRAVWLALLFAEVAIVAGKYFPSLWPHATTVAAGIIISGAAAVLFLCKPFAVLGYENWGLGDAGFLLAYLATRHKLPIVISGVVVVASANALRVATASPTVLGIESRSDGIAKVFGVVFGSAAMQAALVAVYLMLRRNSAAVERTREAIDEIASVRLAEERIALDRTRIYAESDHLVEPILAEIAEGRANPSAAAVRVRCRQALSAVRQTYGQNRDTSMSRDLRAFAHAAANHGVDVELPSHNIDLSLSIGDQAVIRDFLLRLLTHSRTGTSIISFIRSWEPGSPRLGLAHTRDVCTLAVRFPVMANRTKQLEELVRTTADLLHSDLRVDHDFDSDDDPTGEGDYIWVALSGPLSSR